MTDNKTPQKIKTLAVLTSGGDAPGMNCALRAVVRTALKKNLKVFTVNDGFQGLIEDDIHYADSSAVAGIINQGGTILGTARSKIFQPKKAVQKP